VPERRHGSTSWRREVKESNAAGRLCQIGKDGKRHTSERHHVEGGTVIDRCGGSRRSGRASRRTARGRRSAASGDGHAGVGVGDTAHGGDRHVGRWNRNGNHNAREIARDGGGHRNGDRGSRRSFDGHGRHSAAHGGDWQLVSHGCDQSACIGQLTLSLGGDRDRRHSIARGDGSRRGRRSLGKVCQKQSSGLDCGAGGAYLNLTVGDLGDGVDLGSGVGANGGSEEDGSRATHCEGGVLFGLWVAWQGRWWAERAVASGLGVQSERVTLAWREGVGRRSGWRERSSEGRAAAREE